MQSLLILGRQAELGLAELSSLYGSAAVQAVGAQAAIVNVDPCLLAFDRLGGSTKFCKLLLTVPTGSFADVEKTLIKASPEQSKMMPEGKMHLGLSLYGFNETVQRIEAAGLNLKKAIRKTGRSVRLVPNKTAELNSASVIHNKLMTPNGWELVLVRDGDQTHIAQTVKVQDIDSYSHRDRDRPRRDAKVGMLPPKLAQIIINLAVGQLPPAALQNICDIPAGQPVPVTLLEQTILDPFCGTGVLLQEAALMGYHGAGSDIEPRMIEYTTTNLKWLQHEYGTGATNAVAVGDATNHQWSTPPPDFVACETYLGRPFTAPPTPEILSQTMNECNLIIKKSLQNLHRQLARGTRLCVAVPAWQVHRGQFRYLPLVEQLPGLGFTVVTFGARPLVYAREGQIVGRQLLVLVTADAF